MRPVNLIPGGKRGGAVGGGRNVLSYAIIGALVLVLVAVSLLAMYGKQADDNQAKVDSLESQIASAQAEAASLSSFTDFKEIHDARVATIDSLAKSRFDWERVMRELAIVIPDEVWLTNLTGTASPTATVENGAGLQLRATIPGPALEMTGCALNQRTVARLIASVNDIDGVTRVLVSDSAKPEPTLETTAVDPAAEGATDTSVTTSCSIRPSYPTFSLVAAFDGVAPPVDPAADPAAAATPVSTPPAGATTTATTTTPAATTPTTSTTTTTPADGGVAETSAQSQEQQGAVGEADQKVQNAAQIPTGGN
jgi:Tfp pilus assembly protein PilN